MSFEFLQKNFFNTTTQAAVDSNTALVSNMFNSDRVFQYVSDNFANDLTTTTITVAFDETTSISRIGLLGHNLKDFTAYYNGVTANTFSLTSTAATTTSDFSANSSTGNYLRFSSIDVTSVSFDLSKTIVAGNEKAISQIVISNTHLVFPRDPSSKGYKPKLKPKNVIHQLSDGGRRIHHIRDKFEARIKYKYITESFRNSLRNIYDLNTPFMFCPIGTTTAWDEILFECIWSNEFNFYEYSDNAISSGFSGSINLLETSS